MKKIFKFTLLTITFLLLEGCATHTNFVKRYDSWMGQDITDLIKEIGYPDSTFVLPNKNKVYVYKKSTIYAYPPMPVMGYGYNPYYPYYGGYAMMTYGNDIVHESCKLFLETNKKGIIVKWGSRGNACRSY